MEEKDMRLICMKHHLQCNRITKLIGSFDKELFSIDDTYLIRTSSKPMLEEQNKINRIKDLKHVPKVIHASDQSGRTGKVYYLIMEYLQGSELFANYNDLKNEDIHDIGVKITNFLCNLHQIKGKQYDIGHYVPIIPDHNKSWRSGHEKYWEHIYLGLKNLQVPNSFLEILEISNRYIHANISSLDYEKGPVLLHNDFHYKNIIINNHTFSGVIDWECSQYGEADFDLIHLLHWCLYPPTKGVDTIQLFEIIFLSFIAKYNIPVIEKRLTIYLLEHDFIQVLWSKGERTEEFLPRINWWVSGKLEKYLKNIRHKEGFQCERKTLSH